VNHDLGGRWEARSAGTAPAATVHPLAVRAMAEVGIDIGGARPKRVGDLLAERWDLVVTVCDTARESCPVVPQPVEQLHVSFPDPALATGTADARLPVFRAVRDDIRRRLLPEIARRG
jgi:arsenate reductase (thioredoxin)